ncbi:hypothetical protein BSLG_006845 [Batrachochytrium salamandrivorans]|nr:hypothetical protein BSLG_006845 [Batrachochytrium salamandrivorans]
MSVVFYKFKSAKDFDTCTFDGAGISVFDLKREIMFAKKLGKGQDFDLALHNAQTKEEYTNDSHIINRNSSVLVSRNPPSRPGKGTAQRYLGATAAPPAVPAQSFGIGRGRSMQNSNAASAPMPVRPMSLINNIARPPASDGSGFGVGPDGVSGEDKISLMFKQEADQWRETQDRMAVQRPVFRPMLGRGRGAFIPPVGEQRPPPSGYICYRCGQKGHYINMCPTIGDKEFDNRPKLKRTTGIPKMFLKTIEIKDPSSGIMVTQTGEFVVATPNDEAWVRQAAQRRTHVGAGDVYEMAPVLAGFECRICEKLLRDAVTTSCCGSNFCDECIRRELLDPHDLAMKLKCPECKMNQVPDQLSSNKSLRQAVQAHLHDFATQSNNMDEEDMLQPEEDSSVGGVPASSSMDPSFADADGGIKESPVSAAALLSRPISSAIHAEGGDSIGRPIETVDSTYSKSNSLDATTGLGVESASRPIESIADHDSDRRNERDGRQRHGSHDHQNRRSNQGASNSDGHGDKRLRMNPQWNAPPFLPQGMPMHSGLMQGILPPGLVGLPFHPPAFQIPPGAPGYPSRMGNPAPPYTSSFPDRDQRGDVYNGEDRGRNRQREEGSSGHHKRIRTGGEFSEHGRDRDSVSDRSHNDESSQRMGDDGHSDPNAPPMRSDRGSHGNSHATSRRENSRDRGRHDERGSERSSGGDASRSWNHGPDDGRDMGRGRRTNGSRY